MKMNIKRVKRRCEVRGCKNKADVFLIARSREVWNTPAICKECLKDALAEIDAHTEVKAEVTVPSVAEKEPEPVEVIETVTEDSHISATEDAVTKTEEKPKTTSATKKKVNKKK